MANPTGETYFLRFYADAKEPGEEKLRYDDYYFPDLQTAVRRGLETYGSPFLLVAGADGKIFRKFGFQGPLIVSPYWESPSCRMALALKGESRSAILHTLNLKRLKCAHKSWVAALELAESNKELVLQGLPPKSREPCACNRRRYDWRPRDGEIVSY